jgi:hypothetical protein
MFLSQPILTTTLFTYFTASGVYILMITITVILFIITIFIVSRGIKLKEEQSKGNEKGGASYHKDGNIIHFLIKASGIVLTILPPVFA